MKKTMTGLLLVLTLLLSLTACGAGREAVSVQRADRVAFSVLAQERYGGMVISGSLVQVQKDPDKTVLECYVTQGQKVTAGERLFSYDTEALELEKEKQQLEIQKMTNEKTNLEAQKKTLEEQLKKTRDESVKVRLTLEINTVKTQLLENDYQMTARQKEMDRLRELLANGEVVSPVEGTVRKIDPEGQSGAYMTIQESGAFQVKGSLNEMNLRSGVGPGVRMKVFSRIDPEKTWMGTVLSVDMEGGSQSSQNPWGDMGDPMSTSTSYPFYVEMEDTQGLLLGQHVYMELSPQEGQTPEGLLLLPESFLTELHTDPETGETGALVWAESDRGTLEQRPVVLGLQEEGTGAWEILEGLMPGDYVADPAAPGVKTGAPVQRREPEDFGTGGETEAASQPEEGEEMP